MLIMLVISIIIWLGFEFVNWISDEECPFEKAFDKGIMLSIRCYTIVVILVWAFQSLTITFKIK